MKKLFVGLKFDPSLSESVQPWIKKIRKTADHKEILLKWVPLENFHVTLVFLGQTSEDKIEGLGEKIEKVASRHSQFSLKIDGIGAFPEIQRARVIYLGVQRSQAILDLQSDLETELLLPEQRQTDYRPHLTLARLRNPKSCRDLLSPFQHIDLKKQPASHITLFESLQVGAFPVYTSLCEAALGV